MHVKSSSITRIRMSTLIILCFHYDCSVISLSRFLSRYFVFFFLQFFFFLFSFFNFQFLFIFNIVLFLVFFYFQHRFIFNFFLFLTSFYFQLFLFSASFQRFIKFCFYNQKMIQIFCAFYCQNLFRDKKLNCVKSIFESLAI